MGNVIRHSSIHGWAGQQGEDRSHALLLRDLGKNLSSPQACLLIYKDIKNLRYGPTITCIQSLNSAFCSWALFLALRKINEESRTEIPVLAEFTSSNFPLSVMICISDADTVQNAILEAIKYTPSQLWLFLGALIHLTFETHLQWQIPGQVFSGY